jgi:threonyl-tRNA synthetase
VPRITLPDGSVKSFDAPVTARQVAESIGPRLALAAVGCKVNGELRDLSTMLSSDCSLSIVTETRRDAQGNTSPDPDALFLSRHSAAHVMAEAIQDVIGKDVQLAYGPPTETGFFYDMFVPAGLKISSDDFGRIEKRIAEIIKEDRPFTRYEVSAKEGLPKLGREGNKYKADNALRAMGCKGLPTRVVAMSVPVGSGTTIGGAGRGTSGGSGTGIGGSDNGRTAAAIQAALDEMCGCTEKCADESSAECKKCREDCAAQQAGAAKLSFYVTGAPGKNWEDLCRGPHVPSTGRIGAVKVMSLASAYWHGDENSDRLIRVYGTSFFKQKDLDEHLNRLEEAKKRDHRAIGKALRLFHIDEDVGQGLILWTPKGSVIRKELQTFIASELRKQGYTEVFTPHIGRLELYKTSGHFPYYKDSQFAPIIERNALEELSKSGCTCAEMLNRVEGVAERLARGLNERAGKEIIAKDRILPDEQLVEGFMLRPMNCPHHAKIFGSAPHSYRDMPVRLAEFGTVYRWEQSGELNGMTRVRGFTQDDAHLFCTEEQIPAEIQGCLSLVKTIFNVLGMKEYRVRVGLRDPDSSKYTGSAESWDKAEKACIDAAKSLGVTFSQEPGEAAFYGPKIDFVVKDVIGREWQLGTVQVDYQMGYRFDLSYVGPDNKPHRPVVIHRAPFGSMERFCGVLIEHFAGAFPTWLSPEQCRVLPISDKTNEYGHKVLGALQAAGVRATIDDANERVQAKIKVAADEKIPYLLIVGPRDAESGQVSVRARGQEKDLGAMPLEKFVSAIKHEIETKGIELGVRP